MYINAEGHTQLSLSNLLRHDPKDRENLHHDLHDDVRQSCCRPDLDVLFKTLKKAFHTAKQVYQSVLAGADILNGLDIVTVTNTHTTGQERCLLGREYQSQQKSHSKVEMPAIHIREFIRLP